MIVGLFLSVLLMSEMAYGGLTWKQKYEIGDKIFSLDGTISIKCTGTILYSNKKSCPMWREQLKKWKKKAGREFNAAGSNPGELQKMLNEWLNE